MNEDIGFSKEEVEHALWKMRRRQWACIKMAGEGESYRVTRSFNAIANASSIQVCRLKRYLASLDETEDTGSGVTL